MPSRQKNMTRACRWHSKRHDCSNCRSRKYFPIKTKLCGISSRRVASSLKCDKTCFRSATVYREKDISVSMQTLTPQEEGACVGTEMSGGQPLPSCRTSNLNPPRLTSRWSQPPLALSVPPSRFTSRVGGGSTFYVRRQPDDVGQHSSTSFMKKSMAVGLLISIGIALVFVPALLFCGMAFPL